MAIHHAQMVLGEENCITHLTPLESDQNRLRATDVTSRYHGDPSTADQLSLTPAVSEYVDISYTKLYSHITTY